MGRGGGGTGPYPVLGSCDADGLRASQLQHAVQDLDRHVHLSRPTLIRTRAQPVPDHALEPAHGGLGPGARVVARGLLPAHPALLGDELQVAVPLRRRGLVRGAGHGGRARRNDDVRLGMALGHVGVNALLVVRAVRRDGGDRVRDLVQQGADLGGGVLVAVGQGGGHDPAGLGVHPEMELPPRPAPLGAVLLDPPRARAGELQPRAVDQQVHGAGIAASAAIRTVAARLRPRPLQRLGPAAQGGVVRHGEVEPEQADDGADQPPGLPVRQPEHGLERQRRQDRQVGILGLPAPARAPLGLPRLDRLVRKPDSHAAAPAQALVVIAPVRGLALLLRDVAASGLVQLEGQGGHPGSDGGLPCYLDRAPGATRGIPATTCRETKVASEPEALVGYFSSLEIKVVRIGLEAGPLSQWLYAALTQAGFEVVLLETRHVKAALSAMTVKKDRRDARGIAQLLRMGWYRPVHCKTLPSQEVRAIITARKTLLGKLIDIELSMRGILRGFGLKVGAVTRKSFEIRVRELIEGQSTLTA